MSFIAERLAKAETKGAIMLNTRNIGAVIVAAAAVLVIGVQSGEPSPLPAPKAAVRIDWERVSTAHDGRDLDDTTMFRAEVPGGWLICIAGRDDKLARQGAGVAMSAGLTFVPDPEHHWK